MDHHDAETSRHGMNKTVTVHHSLTQKKYFWGVGMIVLLVDIFVAWLFFAVFRITPPFFGGLILIAAFTWSVKKARENDQFAIEIVMRELSTERDMPAQPQMCEKPHQYRPSATSKS